MANVVVTQERMQEVGQTLLDAGLDWFCTGPGFRFRDSEGDDCIVVGWGGYRTAEPLGNLELYDEKIGLALFTLDMRPPTLVGAYLYKGEHFLFSIPDMENLAGCQPHPGNEIKRLAPEGNHDS